MTNPEESAKLWGISMTIERESLPALIHSRTVLQSKLSSAQNVFENIITPGFFTKTLLRLDTTSTNLDRYIDNLDRVTAIQERLNSVAIPHFQSQLFSINEQIESLTRVDLARLDVLRVRYQRIQERIRAGLQIPHELLTPITAEIQRLEEFTGVATPHITIQPEPPPMVVIEPHVETPEVERLQVVVVNRGQKETESNGKQSNYGDLQWDTLLNLIQAGKEGISAKDLEQAVKKAHPDSSSRIGAFIYALRYKLEADFNKPKVITTTGNTRNARYFFNAEVRFVEETPAPPAEEPPAEDRQAQALVNIAEIQKRVDSVVLEGIEAIAKAQEYARALGGTIEFTAPAEPEPGRVEVLKAKREIEEEIFELPNERLFIIKTGRAARDIFRLILNGHLEKTPALLADLATSIYDSEISDLESDLDLAGAKRRISANITHLNNLLEKEKTGYMIKNLISKSDTNKGIPSSFDLVEIAQVKTEQLERLRLTIEAEPLVETPSKKLTERQRERKALVTDRVQTILQEFNPVTNFKDGMTGKRLTHLVKEVLGITIKKKDMEKAEERGYITPAPADGHHVSYSQKDTITLVYLKRFGNNRNATQRKALIDIIEREYTQWALGVLPREQRIEVIEEEPVDLLTQEEAAVIASLLTHRKDFLTQHQFTEFPAEVTERLMEGVQLNLDAEQLKAFRIQTLERLISIISGEKLDQIYDYQKPDIQRLLIYFIDKELSLRLLEELLTADLEASWRLKRGDVEDFQQKLRSRVEEPGVKRVELPFKIVERPYKPQKLEIRSAVETGLLEAITSQLRGHTRLYFEDLQKALAPLAGPERIRVLGARRQFAIYQPQDLKRVFSDGLMHLRTQAASKEIFDAWKKQENSQDLSLWEATTSVVSDLVGGDWRSFEQRVLRAIDSAEKEFYAIHPTRGGQNIYWLDLD